MIDNNFKNIFAEAYKFITIPTPVEPIEKNTLDFQYLLKLLGPVLLKVLLIVLVVFVFNKLKKKYSPEKLDKTGFILEFIKIFILVLISFSIIMGIEQTLSYKIAC